MSLAVVGGFGGGGGGGGRAATNGKPFKFEYFVIFSKIYKEAASTADDEDEGAGRSTPKKKKNKKKSADSSVYYFQIEDEVIAEFAELFFDYKFSKEAQSTDSRRAFQEVGIDPLRRVFIVHRDKMEPMVAAMEARIVS
ncbi:hypothetical protein BDK51DRAFT_26636 [Blyttiomyces helicus]|uniref:Uncharacterized protein n=1 Tax=Blyttiomyces helicus TaxID=388810 RepID=A0A4P9WAN7_9FUNG|nr:hypothetical protein BDK51DRAFT_26636 [Blyttiomyces helicus]|eukprot:RKO89282.1 hypothetical protein BDK51DRAFT_26636 [Blyttiomyces helicus]